MSALGQFEPKMIGIQSGSSRPESSQMNIQWQIYALQQPFVGGTTTG